jgi:DNA-directed RNA polymerase specialized sigma24 family protein
VTTGEELFAALSRLRDAARGGVRRDLSAERVDWRRVESFVRRSRAAVGHDGDDVVQDALFSIAKHVGELEAADAASAVSWATRIVRHKKIDLARARAREGERAEPREGEMSAVDLLERDDGSLVDDRALAVLTEVVEEAIVRKFDLQIASPTERLLKRTQARATLHRVLGADRRELRDLLGLEPSVSDDRLHKWVERGRPLLASVLEGLEWDHEGDARAMFVALREAALARRIDAGLARPDRRKTPKGAPP